MNLNGFAKITMLYGLFALAFPARANVAPPPPSTPPVVAFLNAGKAHCWARTYDAAHMTKSPKQKVTDIAFSYIPVKSFPDMPEPQEFWDYSSGQAAITAQIIVRLKGGERTLFGSAYCKADGAKSLKCQIEGDGGGFSLTQQGDGGVRLDNDALGFSVEYPAMDPDRANDGFELIDPKDDHKSFLMPAATGGLCDASWD